MVEDIEALTCPLKEDVLTRMGTGFFVAVSEPVNGYRLRVDREWALGPGMVF